MSRVIIAGAGAHGHLPARADEREAGRRGGRVRCSALVLAVALRPRLPGRRPATPTLARARRARPGAGSDGGRDGARQLADGALLPARRRAARASSRSRAADRSRHAVALWGVLTGEAPDEVPVDVDEERDVLIVHLVDASDPDAVRERHRRAYERAQRKVVA